MTQEIEGVRSSSTNFYQLEDDYEGGSQDEGEGSQDEGEGSQAEGEGSQEEGEEEETENSNKSRRRKPRKAD